MAKKKNKYIPKSFESTRVPSDTSANIYVSMVESPAWQDLTKGQQLLYLYCKLQYYGEKSSQLDEKKDNPEVFTMNRYKWCTKYKIYTTSNSGQFYKDMEALIQHGFIKCIKCGAVARRKNVYQYSDKWKIWGKPEFKITNDEMNYRMLNKL